MTTNGDHADLEKDYGPGLGPSTLHRGDSLSITPELFEKLYLNPQSRVAGDLRKTFGNPTPLGILAFVISLTPLSCVLMGWRGAGGAGAANIGALFGFGGILSLIVSVQEWIIGNTFPSVVFGSFGAFWLALAMTLQPFYNAYGAFAAEGQSVASGEQTETFNASLGFFFLSMGILALFYAVAALRTNVVFVGVFLLLAPAFGLLTGVYWRLAEAFAGNDVQYHLSKAHDATVGAGALCFVASLLGWYLLLVLLLVAVDFPYNLPVGDLSTVIKGASEKAAALAEKAE